MSEQKRSEIKSSYDTINYFKQKIRHWVYRKPRRYPWRTTKIRFHALIAEILLQRTKAEQVVPVYRVFIKTYPSPATMAESSLIKIRKIIGPLGLQWRALKIKELARKLKKYHDNRIPCEYGELMALPGVGPYAASAYLSLHNDKRALLIDSNTIRLYGRFFGFNINAETRRNTALINLVNLLTPRYGCRRFNYAVLDLGRNICRQKPLCPVCPVSLKCYYYNRRKEHK